MKKISVILLYLIGIRAMGQQSINQANQVFEHEAIVQGDSAVFAITLVNAFPFIAGEVNGVKGKFMFDTGNQSGIDINENKVPLPGKKNIGNGFVSSGQTYNVSTNDTIKEVKFTNGFDYRNLLQIKSGNYSYLEHITPDCIGYIGYNFYKGYLFKLDYLRRKITFYKNTPERKVSKDFLAGEKVLGVINFETRRLPNHPLVKVKIGQLDVLGAFDTGQYGSLQVNDSALQSLIAALRVFQTGKDSNGSNLITVNNILLDGTFDTSLKGVLLDTVQNKPVRKAIQITEPYVMNFGYRFLDQYNTVWDYEDKKIYILER